MTIEEEQYLQKLGSINVCVDPDWEPFEWIDHKGVYHGIGADLLSLIAQRLHVKMTILKTKDWDQTLAFSKEGKCQIISFLNETPKRDEWLLFTKPHFSDPNVFITRQEHAPIEDPSKLSGERIVFPSGAAMEEKLRKDYPNLRIITTESEKDALNLVTEHKADMTMRSLIVAAYVIKKEGWFNLKIAGTLPQYTNHLRIGVIKSEPMLKDILNKAIDTISDEDRTRIVNQYVTIKIESSRNYRMIVIIIALLFAIGFILLWRNTQLKKRNAELLYLSQTDLLTQMHNRAKIEKDFIVAVEEALYFKRTISVLLLDIDYFKQINDTFGHAIGDQVLSQFASAISTSIRQEDSTGRWGGEEFLVVCPSDQTEAFKIAQRIQASISKTPFVTQHTHTISIGVATLQEGDTPYLLLSKADQALYQAKNSGRNKVCLFDATLA